jgi:TonB-dependent SusC/RagA subfamily outer membrane receptor
MLTVAYYFMQVILCSGMLLGYYWLVLRNKKFHQYNRFYLLGVGLFSWIVPLIKISFAQQVYNEPSQIVHLVNIVASNNSEIEQLVGDEGFIVNWNMVAMTLYLTVCSIFLVWLITGLFKVYQLLKTYSCRNLGDVYLIMTNNVKGTPFSFFKYIFWNDAIDPNTQTGQQIMQHELAHVREKHSIDKLFMQVVMMFGWFNPFFWLLKKELNLIHEFIADNKAVKDGDASSLAAMLLAAAYPNQQYILSNPFFFSPIKRRILMLTKTNNPRLSYARRVVVLPLLAVTVMLFAFRKKEAEKNTAPLNKVYTVVIDAGHGGKDFGATATDGTKEKDLTLLLLKAIKTANTNDKIKLVFTREEDVLQTPIEKARFVNEQGADLFITLHANWSPSNSKINSGFEINIPKNDGKRKGVEQSAAFGSIIEQALSASYVSNGVKTKEKGIWVLNATNCPAILIECGYLSNSKDLALLKDEKQRNSMAALIIKGITSYLNALESAKLPTQQQWETASNVKNNHSLKLENSNLKVSAYKIATEDRQAIVTEDDQAIVTESSNDKVSKLTGGQYRIYADSFSIENNPKSKTDILNSLVIIDGTITTWDEVKSLSPNSIKTVTVLKDAASIAVYGEAGKNGVVLITTKKEAPVTMLSPLNNSYIKEKFGWNKVGHREFTNDGIKICSKTDNNVKSITKGTVIFVGQVADMQVVMVEMSNGFISYSGMNNIKLQKGELVSIGTSIGEAGYLDEANFVSILVLDNKRKFVNPENLLVSNTKVSEWKTVYDFKN